MRRDYICVLYDSYKSYISKKRMKLPAVLKDISWENVDSCHPPVAASKDHTTSPGTSTLRHVPFPLSAHFSFICS